MIEQIESVLRADRRIAYALVFGSHARGTARPDSDVDVAIGVAGGAPLPLVRLGTLAADLEAAAGSPVDLVLLDDAPPSLAYRVFRDGRTIFVRDPQALRTRLARAILEYLDFRPIEELCERGVLAHGR